MSGPTRPRVILASQSPRRRELLSLVGIAHEVRPANIDERYLSGESPRAHAERLAREKAATIREPGALVIGCDTIVVIDGDVLGKPNDAADAAAMLHRLSGRTHTVITAVAVAWEERLESGVEEVEVTFHRLSDRHIAEYIATAEPMDKAGAYGIQHPQFQPTERIDGCYLNVVGLPVCTLVKLLAEFNVFPADREHKEGACPWSERCKVATSATAR
jgi:septum formation protein